MECSCFERNPRRLQVNNEWDSEIGWQEPIAHRFDSPLLFAFLFDPNPLWQLWEWLDKFLAGVACGGIGSNSVALL
jgi:hypothetical protein